MLLFAYMNVIWHGLKDSFLMAWEVWWALVLGFAISAIVQAWVPRERIERSLSGSGARPVALATGLGAASSSCSYAAIAIAKSLFQKGASAASALAFQFASTNLVWELGLVLWLLIGWQVTLAGFIGLLGDDFFNGLFVKDAPPAIETIENVIAGPIIAVLSFVCSIGNVPLAAVLWSGGISFAGVMAFIFADLIVLPIILAYRKYYGWQFALRITALMFATMVLAALVVDGLFSAAGLIPHTRPSRNDIFGSVQLDYKLVFNVFGLIVFAVLFAMTMRRGATDPVCGMRVDRKKAYVSEHEGRTVYLCSEHCKQALEADPDAYLGEKRQVEETEIR